LPAINCFVYAYFVSRSLNSSLKGGAHAKIEDVYWATLIDSYFYVFLAITYKSNPLYVRQHMTAATHNDVTTLSLSSNHICACGRPSDTLTRPPRVVLYNCEQYKYYRKPICPEWSMDFGGWKDSRKPGSRKYVKPIRLTGHAVKPAMMTPPDIQAVYSCCSQFSLSASHQSNRRHINVNNVIVMIHSTDHIILARPVCTGRVLYNKPRSCINCISRVHGLLSARRSVGSTIVSQFCSCAFIADT